MTTEALERGETLALGQLGASLGFLLRLAQVEAFERFYAELGQLGLKPGEFSVLWLIRHNPGVRQGLVAERLRIKRAHMTKLIRGLELRGFVRRHVPDTDRRSVELTLTDGGCGFVDGASPRFFGYFGAGDTALSAGEMAALVTLLRKFTRLGGAA